MQNSALLKILVYAKTKSGLRKKYSSLWYLCTVIIVHALCALSTDQLQYQTGPLLL
jgi:hypothetical protein